MNFIRFVGLSRSGNHPFLNWLLYKYTGRIAFVNHRQLGVSIEALRRHENHINNGDLPCFESPDRERVSNSSFWDLLVISYENQPLDRVFGLDEKSRNIFILRDPFNYFASRLRHREIGRWPIAPAIKLWKSYAKEALDPQDKIFVNFNRWCAEKDYRQELCRELEVEFNDLGIDEVPNNGGGSSFEGTEHQGSAAGMKTTERWKSFIEDDGYGGKRLEKYKIVFQDQELLDLSDQIFGKVVDDSFTISR
jgi:hypothetical protein